MTLSELDALGIEIRPDGRNAMVIMRHGAVEGWIERSRHDRHIWRALNVRGQLFRGASVSRLIDQIADNLAPK